jgi:hypothetical protein
VPEFEKEDTNVLCLLDVYESNETHDGVSQKWILKVDSKKNDLWLYFSTKTHKISCIGAIPSSIEEAKRFLSKN